MTHQIISSPQKPGVTYEQLRTIASTICHEYKTVLETTRMNGRISSSGRLLVVSKLINTDQFDEWARRVSGCKDPSILKPYDAFMSPDGSIYWVSGPSGFPINSICGILTEYLRNPANGNAIPTLLRMALSCLSSAEQCGLSVNMLFFNSSVNQMMADTSPRNDTGVNSSTLVQSIINSHPALYQALVANASGYRPETLINVIDLWDQGQLPYQTTIHAGVSFHAPTYTANSFSQQIGESIGNMFGNILNIPPVRQGMPQNGGLTPTHGAGAPVHQPKHAAPEPAPRNKDAFSWSPGRTAVQPPRPPVQPAQNVQPPVRQTPQITVKPPQPIKTVTPVKKPKPQIAKVSAQVSQPAPNPAPTTQASVKPTPNPAPAAQATVKPTPTPAAQASVKPTPTPVPTTPRTLARPHQSAPRAAQPAPSAPVTSPTFDLGWQAKKEYAFRDLPAIGASCPAVSLSTGALVRFDHCDREDRTLMRTVKSVLELQADHPIEQTEGLCQLHDVKDFDKSFLVIHDAVDPEGYLPVGHPELLALDMKDKLAIARSMAAIFAQLTEAGWLPMNLIEASMTANPRTKKVIFADGHLLSRNDNAPLSATLGYTPPEFMGTEARATLAAAHYALSVWLYRLFVGGYPLEGRRTIAELNRSGKTEEELAAQLYGADALFCFAGNSDNSLDGLGGRYDEQIRRWNALPDSLRLAWMKTFVGGLHKNPDDRCTPAQWLEIIDDLLKA